MKEIPFVTNPRLIGQPADSRDGTTVCLRCLGIAERLNLPVFERLEPAVRWLRCNKLTQLVKRRIGRGWLRPPTRKEDERSRCPWFVLVLPRISNGRGLYVL